MIYLFNSGFRSLYINNILNTLYLPDGCINEYRYRFSGEHIHISEETLSYVQRAHKGEPVAIIFVDRYSDHGYVYHPIRLGILLGHRQDLERLYFQVQLKEFIYPKDIEKFNRDSRKPLDDLASPSLVDNVPGSKDDGYYAIQCKSIFYPDDDYYRGENDAWFSIVKSLESTHTFQPLYTVFAKARILDQKDQVISPVIKKGLAHFDIIRGKLYSFRLDYMYSEQSLEARIIEGEVKLDDPFRLVSDSKILIDSVSNSKDYHFTSKRYPEDLSGKLLIVFQDSAGINYPELKLDIVEQHFFWLYIFLLLLFFSLIGVFSTFDFNNFSLDKIWCFLESQWPRALIATLQSLLLFWIFRLFGKKIL